MADMTVTPDALAAVATILTPVLPNVNHVEHVAAADAIATLYAPTVIISFPGLSRGPSHMFSDEFSDAAVQIGPSASGYPVLNKLFTYDARTFTPELRSVSEADKLTVMAFYDTNKDKVFPWYNRQDSTWYEVAFTNKPRCRLDGRIDLWRIQLKLLQSATE